LPKVPRTAALGPAAEAAVSSSLKQDGWRIVATNWRGGGGELDIVAQRGALLRVVEVKARSRRDGSALAAVSRTKQRRITAAAEAFLAAHPQLGADELSFCVVTIEAGHVEWWIDAFDAIY